MSEGILFDKTCRGYDRKQVNDFILNLNTTYQEQLSEQSERYLAMAKELDEEKNRSEGLGKENEELKIQLAKAQDDLAFFQEQADELAASLRELHAAHAELKAKMEKQKACKTDLDGAMEVSSLTSGLSAEAKERFEQVCLSRDKILAKLTADRIIIAKDELTKLIERLSADAVSFYRTFTGGDLL